MIDGKNVALSLIYLRNASARDRPIVRYSDKRNAGIEVINSEVESLVKS